MAFCYNCLLLLGIILSLILFLASVLVLVLLADLAQQTQTATNSTVLNCNRSNHRLDPADGRLLLNRTLLNRRPRLPVYRDCSKVARANGSSVVVRFRYGRHARVSVRLRCEKGGWAVILSRGQFANAPDMFDRGWREYQRGFGDEEGEFWLGLANVQMMTAAEEHELKVVLYDSDGTASFAR